MNQDYVYLNVPRLLTAKAWILLPDGEHEDKDWKRMHLLRLYAEVSFYSENNLLREGLKLEDWQSWVLAFTDFTPEGQSFLMANYPDKWNAAWDRNPTKDPSDVRYLVRRLRQMRESLASTVPVAVAVPDADP